LGDSDSIGLGEVLSLQFSVLSALRIHAAKGLDGEEENGGEEGMVAAVTRRRLRFG